MATDVIVSVFIPWDPEVEKQFIESIQEWVQAHGHYNFSIVTAGGEKELSSTLLVGAFRDFEIGKFLSFIKLNGLYDPTHENSSIQVIVKENDKEEFAQWRVRT